MPKALSILFGAFFTAASSWALGRMFLKRVQARFAREEEHLFAYMCGSALLSLLVFLIAATHLLYDATLLTSGIVILAAAWRDGAFKRKSEETLPALPPLWKWVFWPVYTVFAMVCFIVAMSPEMSPDGSSYHLSIIARYYRSHGLVQITTNMYASLSQGLEMLFLNAWAFGRHSAAALVHCSFLLTLPLLLLRFGQRKDLPGVGAAAGIFVMCSPVVIIDGTSAYNDVAVACILFAIFYLCELDAPPLLIGVMGGFAYAVKYTAFLGGAYAAARYALKRRWRDIAVFCIPASALVLPWILRNWIFYQNPFAPLMNRWFPNPFVHLSFEQDYVEQMRSYIGLNSYWEIPLDLTLHGRLLGGFLGPLFLLAPLGLLALRKPLGRRVVLAALLFASTYATNIGTRFLIPALPFVSLAIAMAMPAQVLPVLAVAHAVLGFPDMPSVTYNKEPGWRVAKIPLRQALRIESEDSWLGRKSAGYRIIRMVDQATPPGAVIYAFSQFPDSYTDREVATSFLSARNQKLTDYLQVPLYPDFRPSAKLEFKIPRQRLTAVRVVQTADPKPSEPQSQDVWSIAEFRIFDQRRELPRSQSWRLRANPNPWDVQMAFDNWPLTRWRSWARIRPGMFVEVDMGRAEYVDLVRLEASFDQWGVKLRLEGRDEQGRWKELSPEAVLSNAAPPIALRKAATEELKRDGITHLLVTEENFNWQDFRDNAPLWNICEVGQVDGARLYRLE